MAEPNTEQPSSNPEPAGPPAGRSFGPYEILEEVSRGSFGVVYRAKQRGLDRIVALKVLLAGPHASPEMISRFQREARAAARLRHPCLVPIYDIGSQEGHHYFAMGFIEGEPLSARIARRDVTIPKALALAETLADAMHAAHEQGVVHRDLKPSNILLDRAGEPHITDFGLAKQVDLDTRFTQSGTTLGTPAYMPPEQARGEVDQVDARSDVYALGAVLYEMLTGHAPFAGRSLLEVVVAVLNEPVRPPRQINPKIHRDVQTIVMKCLEKDRRLRYASAAELRDDIRRFRSGEAIRARPIGPARRAGRFLRRHSTLLAAVAIVLLAVGGSVWQVRKMQGQLDQENRAAQEEQERRERDERQREFQSSLPEWKRFWWTPDRPEDELTPEERPLFHQGFTHPAHAAPDLSGGEQIYLLPERQLVSPEAKRFFGDLDARLRFRLSRAAAARGVGIGLQSQEGGLPFVLQIESGRLSLIAPQDLYATEQSQRPPALRVKAEKPGPLLTEGEYQLTLHREGQNLQFALRVPLTPEPVRLAVWDVGLSYWKFKNTQLTIRDAPEGFEILSTEVLRKSAPQRVDDLAQALNLFQNGDYNGAEAELEAIAEKTGTAEARDLLKAAQACYYLGLIQEICHPDGQEDRRDYTRALELLARCGAVPAGPALEARVRLRRLVRAVRQNRETSAAEELARVSALAPELTSLRTGAAGLGEPFGWEVAPCVRRALQTPNRPNYALALGLFQVLGLEPGFGELDRVSGEMALAFAVSMRTADLRALHAAYPAISELPGFVTVVRNYVAKGNLEAALGALTYSVHAFREADAAQALDEAGAEFLAAAVGGGQYAAATQAFELLPRLALVRALSQALHAPPQLPSSTDLESLAGLLKRAHQVAGLDAATGMNVVTNLVTLGEALVAAHRPLEVRPLHEAWPDARLAPVLAQAVADLAASGDPKAEEDALGLLRYCGAHPSARAAAVGSAALDWAQRRARADEKNSYLIILKIQQAYPVSGLLNLAGEALTKLTEAKRYSDALSFFGSARVLFGTAAARLTPQVLAVLEALPAAAAARDLIELRQLVHAQLREQPLEDRLWRLECGDLYLALGRGPQALEAYSGLAADPGSSAELLARVTLRLCAWNGPHGAPLPPEVWASVTNGSDYPEEVRLLARYVMGAVQPSELEAELRRSGGPKFFTEAEWDVARALRARAEGNEKAAQSFLWEAARKAGPARGWPHSLLRLSPSQKTEAN